MRELLERAYRASARDVVRALSKRMARGWSQNSRRTQSDAPVLPDESFLRSAEYCELMSLHLPYDGSHDDHEAQNETKNYRHRHIECSARLGVFRWRGMQKHLDDILELVTRPGARVIDFGGAGGPLGLGSIIVDRLERDIQDRPVPFRSLSDAGTDNDVIFSSHALEHIVDIDGTLEEMRRSLRRDGVLLLHVPAFSCERWRAGVHSNRRFNDHVWTFGLGPKPAEVECKNYVDLREQVAAFFEIECAEYCGDDSIFIRARRAI